MLTFTNEDMVEKLGDEARGIDFLARRAPADAVP